MPRKIKDMDLVYVTWEDAYSAAGWQTDPHKHEPAMVASVGFVVFSDKRGIKLANGCGDNEEGTGSHALGGMFIPRGMVRKITKLKVPK